MAETKKTDKNIDTLRSTRKPFEKKRVIVPVITAVVFIISGIFAVIYSLYYQSTDDAFIEGNIVQVAPKVSGEVVKLFIDDNDEVKEGDILLKIDEEPYKIAYENALARLEKAKADLKVSNTDIDKTSAVFNESVKNIDSAKSKLDFASKDYNRYKKLIVDKLCTKQEYEESKKRYEVALADYKSANEKSKSAMAIKESAKYKLVSSESEIRRLESEVKKAKLNLSYTTIYASQSGTISSRTVEEGNYINIGQPLFSIVSKNIWVVANFKETQIKNMKKDQKVEIKIDTFGNRKFIGKIDSIQRATGAKSSLFPPENAVGSYIKIVQRIPVKIVFDEDISAYNLSPGMSCVPKVKVR